MNERKLRRLLPRASQTTILLNSTPYSEEEATLAQCSIGDESVAKNKGKERDPRSRRVRIVSRRRRTLDPGSNLWGGSKYFEDALRYAGLLHDDSEKFIEITVTQEKVDNPEDEATIIEIDIPQ